MWDWASKDLLQSEKLIFFYSNCRYIRVSSEFHSILLYSSKAMDQLRTGARDTFALYLFSFLITFFKKIWSWIAKNIRFQIYTNITTIYKKVFFLSQYKAHKILGLGLSWMGGRRMVILRGWVFIHCLQKNVNL